MRAMSKQTAEDISKAKELAILNGESLYHYKLIARSIGRDEDTLLRWRSEDKDFADKMEVARTAFIQKQMGKARPDFLLERLERDIFGQKLGEGETGNLVEVLLAAYGLRQEGKDARKTDEAIQGPSDSEA